MYTVYPFRILNGKSSGRCHCIATIGSYDFLICLEATSSFQQREVYTSKR